MKISIGACISDANQCLYIKDSLEFQVFIEKLGKQIAMWRRPVYYWLPQKVWYSLETPPWSKCSRRLQLYRTASLKSATDKLIQTVLPLFLFCYRNCIPICKYDTDTAMVWPGENILFSYFQISTIDGKDTLVSRLLNINIS